MYVLTTAKLDAMGHRWITGLANYNFHLHYWSGKSNVEADALSRIDWGKTDKTLSADSIQAIVTTALIGQGNDCIDTIPCSLLPCSNIVVLSSNIVMGSTYMIIL